MPAAVIPNEGLGAQLLELLGKQAPGVLPWQLLFWVNDIEPDAGTVLADLEEATFGGYARLTLDRDEWTGLSVANGCAKVTWGMEPQIWYVTSGPVETIYGYAFLDPGYNVLRLVQRFDDADIEPIKLGGKVMMLPEYTLTSCACPTSGGA